MLKGKPFQKKVIAAVAAVTVLAGGAVTPRGAKIVNWLERTNPFYNDAARVRLAYSDVLNHLDSQVPVAILANMDRQIAGYCSRNFIDCPVGLSTKNALDNLTEGVVAAIHAAPSHDWEKWLRRDYCRFLDGLKTEIKVTSRDTLSMQFRGFATETDRPSVRLGVPMALTGTSASPIANPGPDANNLRLSLVAGRPASFFRSGAAPH